MLILIFVTLLSLGEASCHVSAGRVAHGGGQLFLFSVIQTLWLANLGQLTTCGVTRNAQFLGLKAESYIKEVKNLLGKAHNDQMTKGNSNTQ